MDCCRDCHLFTWAGLDDAGRCLSCRNPSKPKSFDINPIDTLQTGPQRERRKATLCVHGHPKEVTGHAGSLRYVCRECERERDRRRREKRKGGTLT